MSGSPEGPSSRRGLATALIRWASALLVGAVLAFLAVEVWSPAAVPWEPAELVLPAERAGGLVLQDRAGTTVWATRGYGVYRSDAGAPFVRVATIVPRFGSAWAGFSRTFRDRFRYQELVELVALGETRLLVFAGGDAYRLDVASGEQELVHSMRYFGTGRGRGVMPHGITRDPAGVIYYGEYPTGTLGQGETVRIWRTRDEGRSWEVAHEFAPGFVRHVHALHWDPHGQALWVATGDHDAQSRIGYSRDGGKHFTWIGTGAQRFRAVSLFSKPDGVVWAMDTERPNVDVRVMAWDRRSGAITASETVLPSPGYYAQSLGGGLGVVTLAERDASVWLVSGGEPHELLHWPVRPDPSLPHPAVRLLRSSAAFEHGWLLVNPLRTEEEPAAIYRVRLPSGAAGS